MNDKVKIVILAAGRGTRMKSDRPKALAEIRGKLMLHHLREAIAKIHPEKPVLVIGYQADLVRQELGDAFVYALQREQLGTAHAVMSAKKELKGADNIMVLYGDNPFIKSESIQKIINRHEESGAVVTFAVTRAPQFTGEFSSFHHFGRILRQNGKIMLREYKDCSGEQKKIQELNVGCFIFKADWLWNHIDKVKNENAQKEYYINDLVNIAAEEGALAETIEISPREALGANSKEELEILEKFA